MSPPLSSQDVERRLTRLHKCIMLRMLYAIREGREIQSLREGGGEMKIITLREKLLHRDWLDIKYLAAKERVIVRTLNPKS